MEYTYSIACSSQQQQKKHLLGAHSVAEKRTEHRRTTRRRRKQSAIIPDPFALRVTCRVISNPGHSRIGPKYTIQLSFYCRPFSSLHLDRTPPKWSYHSGGRKKSRLRTVKELGMTGTAVYILSFILGQRRRCKFYWTMVIKYNYKQPGDVLLFN